MRHDPPATTHEPRTTTRGLSPARNALSCRNQQKGGINHHPAKGLSPKFNHILGPYYREVKERMPGPKASKWALVPVMRKLLLLMNRIARDPDFVPQQRPKSSAA